MKLQDVYSLSRPHVHPDVVKVLTELHKDISTLNLQITDLVKINMMLIEVCGDVMKGVQQAEHSHASMIKEAIGKITNKYDGVVQSESPDHT